MGTSHTTSTYSKVDSWLLHHATALLAYAKTDATFSANLAHSLLLQNWKPTQSQIQTQPPSTYLVPQTKTEAILEGNWLLQTLDENVTARAARGLLTTWAYNYQVPQDLIFGVVGLAVIGPTLGLIQSKKKKRSHLQVVVDKKWYTSHSTKQLIELVQTTSQKVLAQELRLAGGNAFRMHPDTAAWCLEEPLTKIFFTDHHELTLLQEVAEIERLSHTTVTAVAIALSPTIDDSFVREFNIEEIK